jgi:hypothetical protein
LKIEISFPGIAEPPAGREIGPKGKSAERQFGNPALWLRIWRGVIDNKGLAAR